MRPISWLLDMIGDDMSAGDPSDTIPPPLGEDDAYSATTKVGAMPAELMAKLRAEGLLPEAEERRGPPRPTKGGADKATDKATTLRALEAARAVGGSAPPPSLISRPPGKDDETLLRPEGSLPPSAGLPSLAPTDDEALDGMFDDASANATGEAHDDAPVLEVNGVESSFPPALERERSERPVVETPVAFAAPPAVGLAAPGGSISPPSSAAPSAAVAAPSKKGRVVALLAILALVAVAVMMALSGRGR